MVKQTFSYITISLLIATLLVDSLLSDVSTYVNKDFSEFTRVVLFSTIIGIAVFTGSYVIKNDTNKVKQQLGSRINIIPGIAGLIAAIQYAIVGLLILITIQIIFTSQYYIVLATSNEPWAIRFREHLNKAHGLDISQSAAIQLIESIVNWKE